MFEISFDPDERLLRLVLQGFWTMPVFEDFDQAFRAAVHRASRDGQSFNMLSDSRNFPVQTPDVGMAFGRASEEIAVKCGGKCAIVVASTLNKLQVKRALPMPTVEAFTSIEEAMQWLKEPM